MNLARVVGTVTATRRSDTVKGPRWLLVEESTQGGQGKGEYLVALDLVGADRGQLVMTAQGSSCRWHVMTEDQPIDTVVLGIVDTIDESGRVVYP
jgi:ethanolamine utilization protein EutN